MSEPIKLPSGAELKITLSDFDVAQELFDAFLEELKSVKLDPLAEVDVNLYKDLFCVGFSSKKIKKCLQECFKRASYNGMKIDKDTFQPEEARQDYLTVCIEVAKANIMPFMKSLSAQYSELFAMITTKDQA